VYHHDGWRCCEVRYGAHGRAASASEPRPVFEKGVGICGADLLPADPEGLLASSSAVPSCSTASVGIHLSVQRVYSFYLSIAHVRWRFAAGIPHAWQPSCASAVSRCSCIELDLAARGESHRRWWSAQTLPRWSWCQCHAAAQAASAPATPLPAPDLTPGQANST